MNEQELADVLILARGGGSLEDLWPFNEEIVATAIYNSKIPIISAIGHETDFTIADFVADMRAPTPSAAAELSVQDVSEIKLKLNTYQNRYKIALKKKLEYMQLAHEKCMASRVFTDPLQKVNEGYLNIDSRVKELEKYITEKLEETKLNTYKLISTLDAISPLKTLTRGYSITEMGRKSYKKSR